MGSRNLESDILALRQQIETLEQVVRGLQSRLAKGTTMELFLNVELDGNFEPGDGSISCNIMDWTSSGEVDSGADVTVYDRGYQFGGFAGNKALARFNRVAGRWEFVQMECDPQGEAADTPSEPVEGEIESEF